ncbi:MAG: hypothetical protein IT488_07985 [Gammaproteobacteria bacterium]|nr:hypothetical protein [Gammaproteobacteria bacterium]
MIPGTGLFASATFALMLAAFYHARMRRVHVPVMISIMVADLFFPIYLYMTRDWHKKLIEHGELLSFLMWMHLILVITLYVLYVVQIQTARRLLGNDESVRKDHRTQGIGILVTRGLVIFTGALLAEPVATPIF